MGKKTARNVTDAEHSPIGRVQVGTDCSNLDGKGAGVATVSMHTVLTALKELQNGRKDQRFSSLEILNHIGAPLWHLYSVEYILNRQFDISALDYIVCSETQRVKYGYSNRIVADASKSLTPQQSTQTI